MLEKEKIVDLDDYLNSPEIEQLTAQLANGETTKNEKVVNSEKVRKQVPLNELGKSSDALVRHAKEKLQLYLKRSPQYKILDSQIEELRKEYTKYKTLGREDLCEKTRQMLLELSMSKKKFVKLYKTENWSVTKEKFNKEIEKSEELKTLKLRREALEKEYKYMNPNSLIKIIKELRKDIEIATNVPKLNSTVDLDLVLDNDVDEYLDEEKAKSKNTSELDQEYQNLCGHIAKMTDELPSDIAEMSINDIYKLLKENVDLEKLNQLKDNIDLVKLESSTKLNQLSGKEEITNIIFDIFDLETEPEEKPKEMLAASNVEYVKSIAYGQCMRMNMLHNIDDAVAYGLLGLSVAIDKWYNIQKLKDSVVSFNGFAHTYIINNIKKGLYELGSGGMLNKNSIATMVYNRKKQLENFIRLNPELKDIPKDMIESMLDGLIDEKPANVITESSFNEMVGGQDSSDNGDIFTNSISSTEETTDEKFIECKMEYENLIKSIKKLFNLFETKTDTETGITALTKYKVFDKFDYKLFKLCYGLEFKREQLNDSKTVVNNVYSQSEIGDILSAYYAKFGVKKTFSQSAINYRITQLNTKIKEYLELNPGLKAGFEYIYNYFQTHTDAMNFLSNSREELDIAMDRNELRDIYADNEQEMNRLLSDGKRLNDIYQTNDSNPLDAEISDMVRKF